MRMTGKPGFFWGATLLCFLSAPALSVAGGLDAPVADQAKPAPAPRASIKWTKVDRDGTVSTIEKEVPPDSIRTGAGCRLRGTIRQGRPRLRIHRQRRSRLKSLTWPTTRSAMDGSAILDMSVM